MGQVLAEKLFTQHQPSRRGPGQPDGSGAAGQRIRELSGEILAEPGPPLGFFARSVQPFKLPGGRVQHLALAAAGIVNGLGYACIYRAEQTLSGGTTAIICASSPLFTLIAARIAGLEQLIARRIAGMVLGLGGMAVVFSDGITVGNGRFQAMLLAGTASALLWPLYGALLKRYAGNLSPLITTIYFLFYSALTLFVLAGLFTEQQPAFSTIPLRAHLALAYLVVIGSVVAWTVFLWLLKRLDLSVVSALGLINPLIALAFDHVLQDAQLGTRGYIGALLVLAGMGLSTVGSAALKQRKSA